MDYTDILDVFQTYQLEENDQIENNLLVTELQSEYPSALIPINSQLSNNTVS